MYVDAIAFQEFTLLTHTHTVGVTKLPIFHTWQSKTALVKLDMEENIVYLYLNCYNSPNNESLHAISNWMQPQPTVFPGSDMITAVLLCLNIKLQGMLYNCTCLTMLHSYTPVILLFILSQTHWLQLEEAFRQDGSEDMVISVHSIWVSPISPSFLCFIVFIGL